MIFGCIADDLEIRSEYVIKCYDRSSVAGPASLGVQYVRLRPKPCCV